MGSAAMKSKYFKSANDFRRWLEKKHATMTWPESVDEALCFGWIDGIRKSVDDLRYTIRFTPRRRGSVWSAVNIKRAKRKPLGDLFLRTKERQSRWTLREKAEAKQSRLGFLLRSAALVSKSNQLVGSECKAGGDAAEATAKADRRIGEQETLALVTERLNKLSFS